MCATTRLSPVRKALTPSLAVEPLPGQFDQRADSCAQCIQLLTGGERPTVAAAKIYVLEGELTAEDMDKIRGYLINPWTPAGFDGQPI